MRNTKGLLYHRLFMCTLEVKARTEPTFYVGWLQLKFEVMPAPCTAFVKWDLVASIPNNERRWGHLVYQYMCL